MAKTLYAHNAGADWAAAGWTDLPGGGGAASNPAAGDTCYLNGIVGITMAATFTVPPVVGGYLALLSNTVGPGATTGGTLAITMDAANPKILSATSITCSTSLITVSGAAAGTVTINGSITGGTSGTGLGVIVSATGGTVNVVGSVLGGIGATSSAGISVTGVNAAATLNVTGTVTGGVSASGPGVLISAGSKVVTNIVSGTITASATSPGILNSTTEASKNTVKVGTCDLINSIGQSAVRGFVTYALSSTNYTQYVTSTGTVKFRHSVPSSPSYVRKGLVYDYPNQTGAFVPGMSGTMGAR